MQRTLSKAIRIVTVAPIMAALMLGIIFAVKPEVYGGTLHFALSLAFLTVLPLLAYPLQPLLPGYRDKGRDGQRSLAILMAVLGYLLGVASVFLLRAPRDIAVIYITYLLSGLGIVVFNSLLKIKASGHSCGIVGPIAILVYHAGYKALWGLVLLVLACVSSIRMKRHTPSQLVWGGAISLASFFLTATCVRYV